MNINSEVMFITCNDVIIGENSTIAYRTIITTSANPNAPYNKLCEIYSPKCEPINIGRDCWIGAGAIILPGVTIGDGSVVAAGAVVNQNVAANVMVAGVPAKVKKLLFKENK
ncbi:MAG: acyltransferase [Bacteroidales bacterium]|nr:acyltransferase [Bacteroidales bacterium]